PHPSCLWHEGWGIRAWVGYSAFMPWVLPTVIHILPASGQLRIYNSYFVLIMPWVSPTVMHILPASGQLRIYPQF
ncbi:MAG: hypothetical protein FWD49_03685, partial [Firmicutes bacterium]|nr:hypothetical protein [Bacillota bacterium]